VRPGEDGSPADNTPARIDQVLEQARARYTRLTATEAAAAQAAGAILVDTRAEALRRQGGNIPGALTIERNQLEWRLDPTSPNRVAQVRDHNQQVIVVCAQGYSSSLAAASLLDLGLARATDVIGGFEAWSAAGLPVDRG
jgi:rhodanese-related sulfurtransferase